MGALECSMIRTTFFSALIESLLNRPEANIGPCRFQVLNSNADPDEAEPESLLSRRRST